MGKGFQLFTMKLKSMQTTNIIQFRALDPVKNNWGFLGVWIDPMQSPPYASLLMGDRAKICSISNLADNYDYRVFDD
jgi:hypothetical protein